MSGNSCNGKSGVGTGSGAGSGTDSELNLELSLQLEFFLAQTYHLSAGTAATAVVLEVYILSVALSHRRNLLLSEVMYWQSSSCLNLWRKTDSVG